MQYTRLGDTGLVVSRFTLGTMTFGVDHGPMGAVWKMEQADADRLVARALDNGINLFDTADGYCGGQSEVMLAAALGKRRGEVIISTKVGFRYTDPLIAAGLSYRRVVEAVEASLRRLGTDYIDVLSLHKHDPLTPFDETLRALQYVVDKGYVRYVGYSNFPAWMAATMLERQRARARLITSRLRRPGASASWYGVRWPVVS
jgi:aryl-alcohol dehydrogenase-like predicted oxidoreductase